MSLASYARNVLGPTNQVDINLVLIKIGAGAGAAARIAAGSSPETTVDAGSHAAGVYIVTFPGGTNVLSVGQEVVNKTTVKVSVTAFSQTNGVCTATVTTSDASILAGVEQIHLAFLVCNQ
jgi:hypothetical protein